MNATKKIFASVFVVALLASSVFAQDEDFESFDSFDDSSSSSGASSNKGFNFGADAKVDLRYYIDHIHDEGLDYPPLDVTPDVTLKVGYDGSATEFNASLNFCEDSITKYQADIIDELTAKVFLGDFVLSAGKMRVVWGKGDKIHVLDNFNANDYTDFVIPDYLDRRISEVMLRVEYNAPFGWTFEGIYTPMMTGERYASSGFWKPGKVSQLEDAVMGVEGAKMLKASGAFNPTNPGVGSVNQQFLSQLTQSSKMSASDLYPNTYSFDYGQFGFRANGALGGLNLGVSYYFGRCKQVSVDYSDYMTSLATNMATLRQAISFENPKLNYDRLQVFGLEAEGVIGPVGLRAEAAYNMTNDMDGTNRYVRNNSVSYLAGFDVNLPLHNLALNVQGYGTFVLNADKIRDDNLRQYDADYDPTGCYTNNKIVVQISDTFFYEKLKAELNFIYGFERSDFIFMPKLSFKVRDSWEIMGQALVIVCKDSKSEFYDWRNNGFVQLGVSYTF